MSSNMGVEKMSVNTPSGPETIPGASCEVEFCGRMVRNLFTGQLEELPYERGGRQILYREPVRESHKHVKRAWRNHVCRPLSIPPEQATTRRVARENELARRHGTGAWYDRGGGCHLETRGIRSREMRRLDRQDNDAGYGDHAG